MEGEINLVPVLVLVGSQAKSKSNVGLGTLEMDGMRCPGPGQGQERREMMGTKVEGYSNCRSEKMSLEK